MVDAEVLGRELKADREQARIDLAIANGIAGTKVGVGPVKWQQISRIVSSALDALPYGSGVKDLTEADAEFAEGFARRLAMNFEEVME